MGSASQPEGTPGKSGPARGNRLLDALLTIPRGVAQVDFQSSHWTGLLFIVALFVGGWQYGVFGLLGTLVATATAYLLGVTWKRVGIGLEGFCGTLIGVSLVLYLGISWMTVFLVIGGAIAGSVLTSAMVTVLTPYDLPTFTAPFCVITTVMVIGGPSFARVWAGHVNTTAPSVTDPGTTVSWSDVWQGTFSGVGQVFFQDQWYVGVIFLVGLAVAGRRIALVAFLSSLLGLLVGWAFGAQAADLGAGLYGYNSVLTGIALAGTFVVLTKAGGVYAAIGAASAAALTAGIGNLFAVVGGHTLTWPFVLVTWVFLAAVPMFAKIHRVAT